MAGNDRNVWPQRLQDISEINNILLEHVRVLRANNRNEEATDYLAMIVRNLQNVSYVGSSGRRARNRGANRHPYIVALPVQYQFEWTVPAIYREQQIQSQPNPTYIRRENATNSANCPYAATPTLPRQWDSVPVNTGSVPAPTQQYTQPYRSFMMTPMPPTVQPFSGGQSFVGQGVPAYEYGQGGWATTAPAQGRTWQGTQQRPGPVATTYPAPPGTNISSFANTAPQNLAPAIRRQDQMRQSVAPATIADELPTTLRYLPASGVNMPPRTGAPGPATTKPSGEMPPRKVASAPAADRQPLRVVPLPQHQENITPPINEDEDYDREVSELSGNASH